MVIVVFILDFVIFANALKTNRPKMMNIPRKLGGNNSNLAKLITLDRKGHLQRPSRLNQALARYIYNSAKCPIESF